MSGWINVKDELPEEHESVLVKIKSKDNCSAEPCAVAYYSKQDRWVFCTPYSGESLPFYKDIEVTDWMALPK